MSQHLTSSTQQIIRDFETIKQELQTLHNKLVQIEEEKDREMRMTKQKEYTTCIIILIMIIIIIIIIDE